MFLKAPKHILDMKPYVPGKPIEETQREFGLQHVVKLASNENPLGPSPRALKAIEDAMGDLHRYPDASGYRMRHALAAQLKVSVSGVAIGNGSDDLIDLLIRSYCVKDDAIVTSQHGFVAYSVRAAAHGVRNLQAPVGESLKCDLMDMVEYLKKEPRAKFVFLANPNNPTGTYHTRTELRSFLNAVREVREDQVWVVLDYAYWDYVTDPELPCAFELQREFPFVIVMGTFSKVYGLGGARLGYCVAPEEVVSNLDRVRPPFNVNHVALVAGEAALGDREFVARSVEVNRLGLEAWREALDEMLIPYWPSQGNFLLAHVQKGLGRLGGEVFQACLRRGVIFRPVTNYGLPGALRISVGTPEENAFAIRALQEECVR
jgi:histidinol-phosphate aminotransferase